MTPAVRLGRWLGRHMPTPLAAVVLRLARRYLPDLYADAQREART